MHEILTLKKKKKRKEKKKIADNAIRLPDIDDQRCPRGVYEFVVEI